MLIKKFECLSYKRLHIQIKVALVMASMVIFLDPDMNKCTLCNDVMKSLDYSNEIEWDELVINT